MYLEKERQLATSPFDNKRPLANKKTAPKSRPKNGQKLRLLFQDSVKVDVI